MMKIKEKTKFKHKFILFQNTYVHIICYMEEFNGTMEVSCGKNIL